MSAIIAQNKLGHTIHTWHLRIIGFIFRESVFLSKLQS